MGVLTFFLVILGSLIVAAGMTLFLDLLASYCFRSVETTQGVENQASGS